MTTRRQFLSGRLAGGAKPLRPPWALGEAAFVATCSRCGDCIRACPTGILVAQRGFPLVDFAKGKCTFCGDCVVACQPGALQRSEGQEPWQGVAKIGSDCLARHNIVCRHCGDACSVAAIRFEPRLGGSALPGVAAERCSGCGACVAACPARAIEVGAG